MVLKLNQTVFPVQIRTVGWLRRPVANTNYRYTVANVGASDVRHMSISKIIAGNLSLVASRLYRMAITPPWVMCHRYTPATRNSIRTDVMSQ